jgi:hypothetical protein
MMMEFFGLLLSRSSIYLSYLRTVTITYLPMYYSIYYLLLLIYNYYISVCVNVFGANDLFERVKDVSRVI